MTDSSYQSMMLSSQRKVAELESQLAEMHAKVSEAIGLFQTDNDYHKAMEILCEIIDSKFKETQAYRMHKEAKPVPITEIARGPNREFKAGETE